MSRRIAWLVAATTSAVILSFVIPLGLLVSTLAEERAMTSAEHEARDVSILVSGLGTDPRLPQLVSALDERSDAITSVLTPDGSVVGSPDPDLAEDPDVQRAARDTVAFTTVSGSQGEILAPVVTPQGIYVVHTMVPASMLREGVTRAWLSIGLLGAGLMAVSVLVAMAIGRRVATPVSDLAELAHRFKDGDFEARAVPAGTPETVGLADALNQLAARVTELLEAERAQVGELSHRLRTPVTALRLDAEALADSDVAERLQRHVAQLQRTIDAIVRDARRPLRHTMSATCDATQVVRDRMAFWGALAEDQGRPLTVDLPDRGLVIPLDRADLADVLDVLVDNVFAHTADSVPFTVRLRDTDAQAVLEVSDAGPGPGSGPRAGTGHRNADREGTTGLGLQIVRRAVAGVGGALVVAAREPTGTVVRVTIPRASGSGHVG